MSEALIGIIGGSGLYQLDGLEATRQSLPKTPFGPPSDKIVTGRLNGTAVAFLARHGHDHRLLPAEIPYRANIYALKTLGVRYLLSFSSVGSLRKAIAPRHFVLPDQYIDLTRQRKTTFFGAGAVAHVSMAQPVCNATASVLARAIRALGDKAPRLHGSGTYVCIEGPQFSSFAESNWFRTLGGSVVGMTNMPEAKLAREAQIAYASVAMVTDYDCWHPDEADVTAELAIANLKQNVGCVKQVVVESVRLLGAEQPVSVAHTALQSAVVTPLDALPHEWNERMQVLLR